ncbi:MAG: carotenoid 1,2-hydratase [Pseudomonadota bacterium]
MNVVLYGPGRKRWAMTERGAGDLQRSLDQLVIGPSAMTLDANGLLIRVDEVTVPWPSRLRGEIRISFDAMQQQHFTLDRDALHHWWPIAPLAHASVKMMQPELRWQGHAYLDSNWGSVALEDTFERWDWSRARLSNGSALVLYAPEPIAGNADILALQFKPNKDPQAVDQGQLSTLPTTPIWRIHRATQADRGSQPKVHKTLEDTPFYARSILQTQLLGETSLAVHESLSLTRFRQPWVHMLLPFRMPRRAKQRQVDATVDAAE